MHLSTNMWLLCWTYVDPCAKTVILLRNLRCYLALDSVCNSNYLYNRHRNNNNHLTAVCPGQPGRPVPEETFTRSHPSWSTYFLYHLSPFAVVHGILFIQLTCLTVLSNNHVPGPLWSSPWSWTLNFILYALLHPVIIIFSQHMPIPTQPVLLQYQCCVIYT